MWALVTLGVLLVGIAEGCRVPIEICATQTSFCALLNTSEIACWGQNAFGMGTASNMIGDDANETGTSLAVLQLDQPLSVFCGDNHVCFHYSDGDVRCFGVSANGRLGTGTNISVVGSAPNQMGTNLTAFRRGNSVSNPVNGLFLGPAQTCVRLQAGGVKCAGMNTDGQLMVGTTEDVGTTNATLDDNMPFVNVSSTEAIVKVVFGGSSSCWLLTNGRLKCAGPNTNGQLGYSNLSVAYGSTIVGDAVPYVDLGPNQTVVDYCMGGLHTCVIRTNGTRSLLCYGKGTAGRLGRGSISNYVLLPNQTGADWVPVNLGTDSIPSKVYCGDAHTCVLFTDGRVKCWGSQQEGRFAVGNLVPLYGDTPERTGAAIPFARLGDYVVADIAMSAGTTCFLMTTGQVACFGVGTSGELFLGEKSSRGFLPQHVDDGLRFASFGNCPSLLTPTTDTPPPAGSVALKTCKNETDDVVVNLNGRTPYGVCANTEKGMLRCWGNNVQGLLLQNSSGVIYGDSLTDMGVNLSAPRIGTNESIRYLAGSLLSTCAVFADNQMKCWGANTYGNLLLGNTLTHGASEATVGTNLPYVDLLGSFNSNTTIAGLARTWGNFMCAWFDTGSAKCWGRSTFYQLGYDDGGLTLGDASGEDGDSLPFHTYPNDSFVFIEGGFTHTCAILQSRRLLCWGRNSHGATGYGTDAWAIVSTGFPIPNITVPLPLNRTVQDLCLMYDSTCIITVEDSEVYCWGNNQYGQTGLGVATTQIFNIVTPTDLGSSAGKPVDLECGERFVCAIFEDRRVKCWGSVPGLGGSTLSTTSIRGVAPSQMGNNLEYLDLGGRVRKLYGFNTYMCALMENWAVKCWGASTDGALGAGSVTSFGVNEMETMGVNLPPVELGLPVLVCPSDSDASNTTTSVPVLGDPSPVWTVLVAAPTWLILLVVAIL